MRAKRIQRVLQEISVMGIFHWMGLWGEKKVGEGRENTGDLEKGKSPSLVIALDLNREGNKGGRRENE